MAGCPLCGTVGGQRYPTPPEVITREMIDALNDIESLSDLRLCAECIQRLMDGESTSDIIGTDERAPTKIEPAR
jgi:predicted DNA-binding protein